MSHNLHDSEIIAIENNGFVLSIRVRMLDAKNLILDFIDATSWELSPFDMQNIILDFYEYTSETITDEIADFFNITERYVSYIKSDFFKIYCITSSVGMEGFIIAKDLIIRDI